ncbi:MAG: hypothetical protein ABIU54_13445 [Candidatus Eisenbacteria bacterium]
MSIGSRRVAAARRAKARLALLFQACDWFLGVGIVPHGKCGIGLRIDVRASADVDGAALPELFEGLPVSVVRIEQREPR